LPPRSPSYTHHRYGKPHGSAARVKIGQILISCRAKDQHEAHVVEAYRRCKFKFPGRQLIIKSKNWGFTNLRRSEFEAMMGTHKLLNCGNHIQVLKEKGPLSKWKKIRTGGNTV